VPTRFDETCVCVCVCVCVMRRGGLGVQPTWGSRFDIKKVAYRGETSGELRAIRIFFLLHTPERGNSF
jgi:hypothetical protein